MLEVVMRLGFALPQVGPLAGPDSISKVAHRAEELGYKSLWVLDRLLYPLNPRVPYPIGDGSLPELYKRVLDPIQTLAFAAARTDKIGIGTSVLNLPWYNPVLLARTLASLDVLSGGRLAVGVGVGWSPDEYEAAGTDWSTRGKRADEYVSAIKKMWTTDPVEVRGTDFGVSRSIIGLKPLQKPHPPIYMAAYTPGAMSRVAREANGWFPVGVPLSAVGQMFEGIKELAKSMGRDPKTLGLLIRGNVEFTQSAGSGSRVDFTGTSEQIAADIAAVRKLGTDELVLDVQFSPGINTVDDVLRRMEELYRMAG
jgi:probable F420-dependent oxidoreductase